MTREEYKDELRAGVTNYALTVKQAIDAAYKHADETNPNGWHPASELPKLKDDEDDVDFIVILDGYGIRLPFHATYCKYTGWSHDNVKWWSYPPEKKE